MRKNEMPVFIKIDEYKRVIEIMKMIRGKLEDARSTLHKLDELKNKEDAQLAEWSSNLAEINQKMEDIDNALLGPETF